MAHYLVEQYRFARRRFGDCLEGLTEDEGAVRHGKMNSIGWMVGHLAAFDQFVWIVLSQGREPIDTAVLACRGGQPASTPSLSAMRAAWGAIAAQSDPALDALTAADLSAEFDFGGGRTEAKGSTLLRMTGHYWVHAGELLAIRQIIGHTDLPQLVGKLPPEAAYRA